MTHTDYERLITVIARDHARGSALYDDAVQEARIKVWQVLSERDTVSTGYLSSVIRNTVRNVVAHGLFTGHTRKQGKIDASARIVPMPEDYDAPESSVEPVQTVAYSSEVRAVVDALPDRERQYVYNRFWLGLPTSQRDAFMWAQKIKPKLRDALAQYAPVC